MLYLSVDKYSTPIFAVTGDFTTNKEIAALESGADLYARWHNPHDNVASVLAHITRKTARNEAANRVMIYKDLLVSPAKRCAFIGNAPVDLTRQEFDLLYYFLINKGIVLTYEQIYCFIWGDEYDGSTYATIKGLLKRLRRKLAAMDGALVTIQNKWGVGFTLL